MRQFVDEAVIFVRAGRGGSGAVSFRREAHTPRGGPDGGDGGRGGDVILEVSTDVYDLSWLARHPHQRAGDGGNGQGAGRTGAQGKDVVLQVPNGTIVREERGPVADLVGADARVTVAHGGRPGRGNASLASARNRAPRTAEKGEPGEEHRVELELRLVADVGLVGLPNAGKSTLLSRLTAARPKVADYPFTTLTPNLGVAEAADERFVVADVPGLVEGAHQGRGLGDRFLRHVARCRVIAYVVDLSAADPAEDLRVVRGEVASFDPDVAGQPSMVVGTKSDLLPPGEARNRADTIGSPDVVVVSAVTGEGLDELERRLTALVSLAPPPPERRFVVLRPGRDPFEIRRTGPVFVVEGRRVERLVADTDFDDPASVKRLQDRLRADGVERRLADEGARRGDEVLIAGRAFEFLPEE